MTSRPRNLAASLLASVITAAAVLAMPIPASAHSELLDETPAPGSTLKGPPSEVELDFNEPVQEQGSSIVVSVRDTIVSQDRTFAVQGTAATIQMTGGGLPGTYNVSYRIVSEDGHVVSDEYSFEVIGKDSSMATPAPSASDAPGSDTSPISNEESDESTGGVVWVLGLGAIGLVLVAALIAVAVRGRRGRSS